MVGDSQDGRRARSGLLERCPPTLRPSSAPSHAWALMQEWRASSASPRSSHRRGRWVAGSGAWAWGAV